MTDAAPTPASLEEPAVPKPAPADSTDRLDKALSDRDESYAWVVVRELTARLTDRNEKLQRAYRKIAGYKSLRRLLDGQQGETLRAKLSALNELLNGEGDPHDY